MELDFIGVKDSTQRGRGRASKELDRIIEEADRRDMSISLAVDPENATEKGAPKGLSIKDLIKWYERKGFVFDGRVGYRPRRSEDASKLVEKKVVATPADENKILDDVANVNHTFSDPDSMFEAFTQNPNNIPIGYLDSGDGIYFYDGKTVLP